MKVLIQLLLISAISFFGHQAAANNQGFAWDNSHKKQHSNNFSKKQQKQYNFRWSDNRNNRNSWRSANNGRSGWNNGNSGGHNGWQSGRQAHSVPELDTNVAPLAGLLLGGLLAAGFEKRRRKQLKTIKN